MPGTTTNYALPYPLLSDPADISDAVQPLAEAVDAHGLFETGDLKMTARSSASTGWLLCDGAAVSRTTYADLFSAIGTAYGAGNGTTTFNLPDLRGRVPMGVDGAAGRIGANDARGNASGLENHTLSTGEMPAHTHQPSGGSGAFFTDAGTHYGFATGAGSDIAFMGMNNAGGGAPHNNLPPYQVVNYVVKT